MRKYGTYLCNTLYFFDNLCMTLIFLRYSFKRLTSVIQGFYKCIFSNQIIYNNYNVFSSERWHQIRPRKPLWSTRYFLQGTIMFCDPKVCSWLKQYFSVLHNFYKYRGKSFQAARAQPTHKGLSLYYVRT